MIDLETFHALITLQADYTAALDAGDWERWPEFFTEQCQYKLQPRENHEQGLPLATLSFESRGMLKDRVYGIRETLFHDPYYQRHVVGMPRVLAVEGRRIHTVTNYAVFRTKPDELSSVFNVGRYLDTVVLDAEGARFEAKWCVFDSEMIPNSIIYPI